MKMANGMGSVYKLSGKRRNPWIARKTKGWDLDETTGKAKQLYTTIGYFPTRQEALTALVNYNNNPYDIEISKITFEEIYERWSAVHFPDIERTSQRAWISAFNHSKPLHKMPMRDIRTNHLEDTIKSAEVGSCTKKRMKNLYNLMYKYALKYDILEKNYATLCDNVKPDNPVIIRKPFTDSEIAMLWENITFPFVDMVLIGIYSGWRPQELAKLRIVDINLEEWTYYGGLKTNAGRNRCVPIHPLIRDLVKTNYEKAVSMGSSYLFNDKYRQQGIRITYNMYRERFIKINKKFGMTHRPHDTRHTFITKAKGVNVDEYILKLIVGHVIEDVTEKVYTHRTIQQLQEEISKIK